MLTTAVARAAGPYLPYTPLPRKVPLSANRHAQGHRSTAMHTPLAAYVLSKIKSAGQRPPSLCPRLEKDVTTWAVYGAAGTEGRFGLAYPLSRSWSLERTLRPFMRAPSVYSPRHSLALRRTTLTARESEHRMRLEHAQGKYGQQAAGRGKELPAPWLYAHRRTTNFLDDSTIPKPLKQ